MQIHNYGAGQTLFAYNNWGNNAGGNSALGIGNDPNTARRTPPRLDVRRQREHVHDAKRLQVVVGGPAQPSAPAAPAGAGRQGAGTGNYVSSTRRPSRTRPPQRQRARRTTRTSAAAPTSPPGSFSRVAYFLELTTARAPASSTSRSTPPASPRTPRKIGIPTVASGEIYQQNVTNMNVTSDAAGVINGTGITTGNVEFWPSNYSAPNAAACPTPATPPSTSATAATAAASATARCRSTTTTSTAPARHAGQTLLACNAWGTTGTAATWASATAPTAGPDWTFAGNASTYTVKNLYVLVQPVPEPAGLSVVALAALGLSRVGGRRDRRRHSLDRRTPAAQVDRQHRHVRRRDAADAQGLAEAARGELRELLPGLVPQADDARRSRSSAGISFCSSCANRSICRSWRAM